MQFAPAIYEHAARLIGRTPWEVSRDPELLYQAHAEAFRVYRHRPVVVGIDVYNVEAEAYGATLAKPVGDAIPAVAADPGGSAADILGLPVLDPAEDGRIPMILRTATRLTAGLPEADVRVPVSGPFSIAANLIGLENLLGETASEPESVKKALLHLAKGQIAFGETATASGVGLVVFETAATPPLLSPRCFREVVFPPLATVVRELGRMAGHPAALIAGGNTYPILDCLIETGAGFLICPSETDQQAFMDKLAAHPGVAVRVSLDPQLLASGNLAGVYREVDRIMDLIGNREQATIGAGVIPYETDPAVVLKVMEYVRNLGRE